MDYAHNASRRAAEWNAAHPDRRRAIMRRIRSRQRAEVLAHYGGRCACCGEDEYVFLAIDHIDGGGVRDRAARGGADWAGSLIRDGFPPGYQVLCHNCNFAKERPGGCPHSSGGMLQVTAVILADAALVGKSTRRRLTCPRGHELAGENLVRNRDGRRECRTCKNGRRRQQRAATAVPKAPRTHCRNGHELSTENGAPGAGEGMACRQCARDRQDRFRAKRNNAAGAGPVAAVP